MSHVAILLPHMGIGGVQRSMLRISNELAQRGHQVDVVLQQARGMLLPQVSEKVRVVDLQAGRMATSVRPLATYLRRARPEAMLAAVCNANVAALFARRLSRVPVRLVLREASAPASQRAHQRDNHRLARIYRLVPHVYPWADRIIAISEGVAAELAESFSLDRESIDVIWNPIYSEELLAMSSEATPHRWLDPGEPPVILGVGRFAREKDFQTLIAAFDVLQRSVDARLILIGDGPLRGQMERQVHRLGLGSHVLMPGLLENPFSWMKRAAVFVNTSLWEGFCNTLVEALSCGTRVVSTDCPHGPAEVLDGGRYGTLVPVRDPIATAEGIAAQLDSQVDEQRLIARAREFSVTHITDRYEQVMLSHAAAGFSRKPAN